MPSAKAAAKIDRYKVRRGEPGCNVVTEFRDGHPVIENPPVALAPPSSSSLPTVTWEKIEGKSVVLSAHDKIAHYRFALIKALWEEMTQKSGLKKHKVIKQFLKDYNSRSLFPNIFENLKKVSRPTIYRWIKAYKEGGIDALVPQYRGPEASGITPAEKEFLLHKLLDQNQPTIGDAINKCKFLLGEMAPSAPSKLRRWVYDFRKNNYDVWVLEREGEKALNDKCVPYAERDWRDLKVGDVLVADGHNLNFQVINPFSGKPSRAVMVLFWDWRSNYPVGFDIMLTESVQCVLAALRNAIITLGKFPKRVYLDNGKAFRARVFNKTFYFQDTEIPGIFEKLGIIPHFAKPYNPQTKPIERFFRTLGDFEREMSSYIGSSIPDKPAYMRRNEKRARGLHNGWIPTIPEAMELLFRWREYVIEQPMKGRDYQRPKDIFEAEKGPGVDPFILHFLMMSCKARMVHRNGITFNGWHWYHDSLYGIKDYVLMFYSYYDLSQVYIFTMQNDSPKEFLCVAKPVEKVKPFAADSEFPEDMAAVQRINAMKRKAINTTKKLADLIQSQKGLFIDWDKTLRDRPEVAEAIKQIENKRKPSKVISLLTKEEIDNFQIPADDEKSLQFDSFSERYEFLLKKDPLTDSEKEWIHQFETGQIAPGEWEIIYGKAIIVDSRTGLSRPTDGTIFKNAFEYYEWYRAIEEKFPGALNDKDWEWIREYEASEEWEDFYGLRGYVHMARPVGDPSNINLEPAD